jgi:thiol-disulfide isomerase/thioredoxin
MKYLIAAIFIVAFAACNSSHRLQKINYVIVPDEKTKVLKGVINRSVIEQDTAFAWFKENMKWGQADISAIEAFKKHSKDFTLLVFGGTWCEDTQNLLPVLFRLADKSGYAAKNISLIAVDRKKQDLHDFVKQYHIVNVPVFIVLHKRKEIGRITEYGKYNAIDKELGEIVNTIK